VPRARLHGPSSGRLEAHRARGAPNAEEIDGDGVLPLVGIDPARDPAATDACVREHDVECAESIRGFGHRLLYGCAIADVDSQRERFGPAALCCLGRAGFVHVEECDARIARPWSDDAIGETLLHRR
jgi:hypothetical protein